MAIRGDTLPKIMANSIRCSNQKEPFMNMLCKSIAVCFLVIVTIFASAPAVKAETDIQKAEHIPWSGYWWPFTSGGLATGQSYRGLPSTLQKYELLTRGSTNGPSINEYLDKYYDPDAPGWYGLCLYWALASVYEHIDFFPSSENNIVFRVGDKKGLLTLAHDYNLNERAQGSSPEVFHYWLLYYIKEQKKAFVADLDAGAEVWSYPIYMYVMEKTVKTDRESIVVTIYYADDFVAPDYMGTKMSMQTLTYDLFLEGDVITGGEWTGESVTYHPDRLTFPIVPRMSIGSLDYNTILQIAQSKDDFLESGDDTIALSPGNYNLILMDQDVYRIDCLNGETIQLEIQKQNGSLEDFNVKITDGIGSSIVDTSVGTETPLSLSIQAEISPYTVRITQPDYSDPNIYTVTLDILRTYAQSIPYVPKNGMWSGFAITNPWSYPVAGVMLTAYTERGDPVQTLFGPNTLNAGEKRIFLFEDLEWRQHEYRDIERLIFSADEPIGQLNMIGRSDPDAATCFVQGNLWGQHLVVPDTISSFSPEKTMLGALTNEKLTATVISLELYNAQGYYVSGIDTFLSKRGNYKFNPGAAPFYSTPENGWIDVSTSDSDSLLSGYQYISGAGFADSLFALPVVSGRKLLPHVPPFDGIWEATLTVINPNDTENTIRIHPMKAGIEKNDDLVVTLSPREKQVIDLIHNFGSKQGEPLYQSVLELSGTGDFVGYFTYKPIDRSERVKYPLIEGSSGLRELVLAHNAGQHGYWWTAACIFNTTMNATTVTVDPYDETGAIIPGLKKELSLEPGAYNILSMKAYFGISNAEKISFIRFRTKESDGKIGGFYMYGATTGGMLSGANM